MISSLVLTLGISSLSIAFIYIAFTQDLSVSFNWHPPLMSLYFACCTYAISRLQRPRNKLNRERSITLHQLFHIFAICTLLLGFIAIYYHKFNRDAHHFTSWHGILGLIVILATFPVMAYGTASVYYPDSLSNYIPLKNIYYFHRVFGYISYILTFTTYALGLNSVWLERVIGPHQWMFLLLSISILALVYRINFKKLI